MINVPLAFTSRNGPMKSISRPLIDHIVPGSGDTPLNRQARQTVSADVVAEPD